MDEPVTLLFTGLSADADAFSFGTTTVALVRTGDTLILFDTGPYAYRPILQGRLRRLAVDPADIGCVVLSHLHWDSASNADLFPNAKILVHARELQAAESGPPDSARPGYMSRALRRLDLQVLEGEHEITPDVRTLDLPGHTPGSIGLQVGRALLAGDAVATSRDAVAMRALGISADPASAAASLAAALARAETIYPGHDRPFRVGERITSLSDYELRIRLFTDPRGEDEELRIGAAQPKSFATWPEG